MGLNLILVFLAYGKAQQRFCLTGEKIFSFLGVRYGKK
jgi:hypothetical protein